MKKYKVLLSGENFELNFEGKIDNFGFYTTRVVKANSEEEAELKAVELIKTDNNLLNMLIKKSEYEPKIFLEEMCEASWWQRTGGAGYTFFSMESE